MSDFERFLIVTLPAFILCLLCIAALCFWIRSLEHFDDNVAEQVRQLEKSVVELKSQLQILTEVKYEIVIVDGSPVYASESFPKQNDGK